MQNREMMGGLTALTDPCNSCWPFSPSRPALQYAPRPPTDKAFCTHVKHLSRQKKMGNYIILVIRGGATVVSSRLKLAHPVHPAILPSSLGWRGARPWGRDPPPHPLVSSHDVSQRWRARGTEKEIWGRQLNSIPTNSV